MLQPSWTRGPPTQWADKRPLHQDMITTVHGGCYGYRPTTPIIVGMFEKPVGA